MAAWISVGPGAPGAQGAFEQGLALGDQDGVVTAAVLVGEQDQLPAVVGAGVAAGVGE